MTQDIEDFLTEEEINELATGNCFENAFDLVNEQMHDALLCHGRPTLTGGAYEGMGYQHAWVEINGHCIDGNYTNVVTRKDVYYAAGQIDESRVKKYTRAEIRSLAVMHLTKGPWEAK